MPWCPECKTEYRPEFDTCSDCGAALVDADPNKEEEPKPPILDSIPRPNISILLSVAVSLGTLGWLNNIKETAALFPLDVVFFLVPVAVTGFVAGGFYPRITSKQVTIGWALAAAEVWMMEAIYWPMVVVMTSTLTISFVIPAVFSAYLVRRLSSRRIVWCILALALLILPYVLGLYARTRHA